MIKFTQELTESDHKKAIRIHFFNYKFTYVGFVFGLVLFSFFCIYFLFVTAPLSEGPVILTLISLFWILRPYVYANRIYNQSLGGSNKIEITDEERIVVTVGENSSTFRLTDLIYFVHKDPFIILYATKTQYLILDKRQMGTAQIDALFSLLKRLGINKK